MSLLARNENGDEARPDRSWAMSMMMRRLRFRRMSAQVAHCSGEAEDERMTRGRAGT